MNSILTSIILELQKRNDQLQENYNNVKEILNKLIIEIYFFLILFYILINSCIGRCSHSFSGFI